ncbi:PIG-L deacetylase family protein [Paenibacillus cremeus]|uniref:PIG-L family deacetylase n=1 Tax=Paenibacillus cremeus TaxID=2163881 RepID=A0A559K7A7_9BACL|nr:PIG-L family deacetylase [Paenibacillus cremeus]TVY08011.1 PIG-L family deacetylase [Paenibacillus cremeus]
MKILAIGAHPDDLEISCAGTLTKMKQAGHDVVLCHASNGDKGHYVIPAEKLVLIRQEEAKQAGAVISCPVISLGLKDGEILSESEEARSAFIDLIRSVQPDMVITHAPNDYMPDHVAVSKLVFDTTFVATLPGFSNRYPFALKVPALFYMDNLSGIDFQPTIYVDVTDTFETKLNMLRQHQSQLVWLKEHDNVDIVDFVQTLGKMRGIQSGCKFAEGFIQHMVWTRPNAVRFPV